MRKKLVLVIEDDRALRDVLTLALEEDGYDVIQASNGFSGLRLAESSGIDGIVLDLALPDLAGLDVLSELRQQMPSARVPVIIVTAHPDMLLDQAVDADTIISKPFDVKSLLHEVATVLHRKHSEAYSPVPPVSAPFRAARPPRSDPEPAATKS